MTCVYVEDVLTHQPRVVYDSIAQTSFQLFWDANGNLAQIQNCALGNARHHFWNEENQLQAAIGPQSAGIYGYDGDGNRVWKLTGLCWNDGINRDGPPIIQGPPYSVYIDDATLYPNPYITISLKGYTKHFYIEQERISTVLGEGGWSNAVVNRDSHDMDIYYAFPLHWDNIPCETYSTPQNEDIVGDDPKELQYVCKPTCIESIYLENLKSDFFLNCISSYQQASGHKETIYFTHDDHLSSASWITDSQGEPVQYIHYAPYGELLANQQATGNSYDERYKFTGKERDAETGSKVVVPRFLAQQLGIWISVDPLVDKYPGISPYAYCNWNPIKFVDPNGQENVVALSKKDVTVGIQNAINKFPVNSEVIHFWAHGMNSTIRVGTPDCDNTAYINTPEDFYLYLMNNSSLWQERKDGDPAIIVLHACSSGKGENSIAQQISESSLFQNVIIVAPSTDDVIVNGIEQGPSNPNNTEDIGDWKMFLNGKMVNSFTGTSTPIFNNPENHVERYLNEEKQ